MTREGVTLLGSTTVCSAKVSQVVGIYLEDDRRTPRWTCQEMTT